MRRLFLAVVLAAAAARAEDPQPKTADGDAAAKPAVVPASAVSPITPSLPPVSGGQTYGAPGSLPPVTAQLFHVGGMFELMPIVQVSLGDPFWRTVAAGLRAEQHLDERWSVSLHALGGFGLIDAPVDVCGSSACSSATQAQLRAAPGRLSFLTGAELGWAPIYGKLSVFGDYTIHFDAYVSAGPELVREIIAPDTTSAERGRWTYGGRVSVGERVFLTNTFMIRLAASELVYSGNVRGSGEIERKLSVEGGVAWLFGVGR
ncbi:MAG TPA: outer membrane beta-barrel domain-containing protein [Myxococcales bacterium]|jgi:outer membrane beta-barrel protein|nr:outer membrane beta-barrel domain-containing protein [Myxococcales bacterium]